MSYTAYLVGGPADLRKEGRPGDVAHWMEIQRAPPTPWNCRAVDEVVPVEVHRYYLKHVSPDGTVAVYFHEGYGE